MSACERAGEFFDGELAPGEAAVFREHLAACGSCQERVFDAMMLDVAAGEPRPRATTTPVIALDARRRLRPVIFAAVATLAVAATLVLVLRLRPREAPVALALAPTRALEPRLTWPDADRHRPLAVMRGVAAHERVGHDLLDRLEQRGDARALGAAELLAGDDAAAERALARVTEPADRTSDLAAVALARGDAVKALELADAALQLQPAHAQASWNAALALRALGLRRAAERGFAAIAARAEPGWSDEARARADELAGERRAHERLDRERADVAQVHNELSAAALAVAQARAALAAGDAVAAERLARDALGRAQRIPDAALESQALEALAAAAAAAGHPGLARGARDDDR
jgi:hypothetical protein